MKNFARHSLDPTFKFSSLLFIVIIHVALLVGVTIGLALQSWVTGLVTGVSLVIMAYVILVLIWYAYKR